MSKARIGGWVVTACFTIAGIVLPETGWLSAELSKWAFVLSIIGVAFGTGLWLSRDKSTKTISSEGNETKKQQAIQLHSDYIQKEKAFWLELEKIPKTEDLLVNPEVKNAMFNMELETNKLATLISRDDFDKFIESLIEIYNRYAEFHFSSSDYAVSKVRNRINRKIRKAIRGIRN